MSEVWVLNEKVEQRKSQPSTEPGKPPPGIKYSEQSSHLDVVSARPHDANWSSTQLLDMSRPFAFFSALRSTLPKRPLASSGFASRFGANAGAGPSRNASHHSSDVVGGGIVSTLFRPITLILICAPILTGYLGVWQIQRLKWKVALIEEVDRNLAKDPMVLPAQIK
jgi:hypothetical protein